MKKSKYINFVKDIFVFIIMLGIGASFFFAVGENIGYVIEKDSYAYTTINAKDAIHVGMMPLYIVFVDICRIVFADNVFGAIAVIQGIIGILSSMIVAIVIKKEWELGNITTVIVYVLSFLPYTFSLREYVATHAIMSEGLSIALFNVYIVILFSGINNRSRKKLIIAFLISVTLLLIRKQMIITVFFFAIVCIFSYSKKRLKSLLQIVVTITLIMVASAMVLHYSDTVKRSVSTSSLGYSLFGKAIYISEESDSEIFDEKFISEGFLQVYYDAYENGTLYSCIDDYEGFTRWEMIINGVNREIRDAPTPLLEYYYSANRERDEIGVAIYRITSMVIREHLGKFIMLCFETIEQSLISTVFIKKESYYLQCKIITYIIVLVSFCLKYICCKKKSNDTKKIDSLFKIVWSFMVFNLLFLNITFMSLQRYVIYPMGVFYITIIILVYLLLDEKYKY